MRRVVIIGNSAAGLAATEAIRSRDRECRVTIVSAEPHLPYSRIMLTYLLGGKVSRDDVYLRGSDWYRRMGVDAMVGYRAVTIDTQRRRVTVEKSSSGDRTRLLAYDRLLIATGAAAQQPTLPGVELPGVFCLRDLDDALSILRYAESNGILGESARRAGNSSPRQPGQSRVVFFGGGPVCLQALVALVDRGMRATLVVRSKQILSQLADADTARLAEKVLRANGVRVVKDARPAGIEQRSRAVAVGSASSSNGGLRRPSSLVVHGGNGRRMAADLVIIGKGTQPNVALARGTGIATDMGILVDQTMATSVPGVFAAGDVAQASHCVTGRKVCYGTWSNAVEQGRIAGLNIAGDRVEWSGGLNRNVTTLFGNSLASVGVFASSTVEADRDRHVRKHHDRPRNVLRQLAFRDGRCEGAVLWNACDDLGALSCLISTRRDCSGWEDRLVCGKSAAAEALRMSFRR